MSEIEPCYKEFGRILQQKRKAAGFSHSQIAEILNMHRVSVANIEAGRQRVLLHHGIMLAKLFRIDLDSLPFARVKLVLKEG